MPKAPRFDPASGENPFAWIVRAAKAHRADRSDALEQHRKTRQAEKRAENEPVGAK